ncbi:MAG: enoyl-CoA hydratase/isomerase family protein, partial [Alphaproteobacteria bacterium]|nr:enoyl-CoA hydratase/isomerase family protein [Alphaproteobacteria bacterium]
MPDTGDSRIRLAFEGHVALVTIARPEKLNALDYEMVAELERAAHLIELEQGVRVAIITGEGEKSFCAGGDIEAWSQRSPQDFGMAWVRHGHRAFDALARLRQPLIAALNGHTLGGGLELAATADFRIAEQHVKLGSPETGLGIIPGWSGTQRTVRRFGSQTVRRMALLGDIFTA